jgi:hypothetical protein
VGLEVLGAVRVAKDNSMVPETEVEAAYGRVLSKEL